MAQKKGQTGNPAGRPKGAVNRATANAREAIASFVEGNADKLTVWLERMAEDDPKAAFAAFMSVVEYHIPKLARTEHAGDAENPIQHSLKVEFVDANNKDT